MCLFICISPTFPPPDKTFSTAIVVCNLPKVPKEKVSKLLNVLTKMYCKLGTVTGVNLVKNEEGKDEIFLSKSLDKVAPIMPFDEVSGKSCGFAFFNFEKPADAKTAAEKTNGYQLDKSFLWSEWFWFGVIPAVIPYLFYFIWKKKTNDIEYLEKKDPNEKKEEL